MSGQARPRRAGLPAYPCLLDMCPIELQGADDLGLQPLDLGEHGHAESQSRQDPGGAWSLGACSLHLESALWQEPVGILEA